MRRTVPASRAGRSGSLRPPAALPPVLHVTRSARSVRPVSCLRGGIRDEPTRPAAGAAVWVSGRPARTRGRSRPGEGARLRAGGSRSWDSLRPQSGGTAGSPVSANQRDAGGDAWGEGPAGESHPPAHHEAGPGRALGLPGPQEPARLVCTRGQGQGAFGAAEVRGRTGPRGLGVPGRSRGLGRGPGTVVSSGVAPACPDPARAAARHPGTPSARRLAPRGKPSLRRRVDGSGREDAPDIWNELSAI